MAGRTLGRFLDDERKRREAGDPHDLAAKERLLLAGLFPAQRDFVLDPARRLVAKVGRGGAKTISGAGRFLRRMFTTPHAKCIYIGLSRPNAEELLWAPFKEMVERLGLVAGIDISYNETKLRATLKRNGATLQLVGADDKAEIEKLRGRPYHEVGIDEAASHSKRLLDYLMYEVIGPRLGDYRGAIWLMGTPGNVLAGEFYDITRPGSEVSRLYADRGKPEFAGWAKWSMHSWRIQDNTKAGHEARGCPPDCTVSHMWEEALEQKAANGWSDDNPRWRREYLAEWAANDTGYVYKLRPHHPETGEEWNIWTPGETSKKNPFGLPGNHQWMYVYGIDLGHHDPTALVIVAYAATCKIAYEAFEWAKRDQSVTDIANLLKAMIERTGYPVGMVCDTAGLGDMILAEFQQVHGLAIKAAEKRRKLDAVELTNGDFVDGLFRVLADGQLRVQMSQLQYDETGMKEASQQPNDLVDAAIYSRNEAKHHLSVPAQPEKPAPGSPAAIALAMEESERKLEYRERRLLRQEPDFDKDEDFSDFVGGL